MAQQKTRKKMELVKPTSAVDTGRASMPPPMEVPTISNIPPINFELHTTAAFICINNNQNDMLIRKKSQVLYLVMYITVG